MPTRNVKTPSGTSILFEYQNPAIPQEDIEWFEQTLISQITSGVKYLAGETTQIGWSILRFHERSPGILELQEPDFKSIPVQWVPGIDRSIIDLRHQIDVAKSILPPVMPAFPSIQQGGLVYGDATTAHSLVLERKDPENAFSGWSIVCVDNAIEGTPPKLESLFWVALQLPKIVPFLALPSGFSVTITKDIIEILKDGEPVSLCEGSFLAAWIENSDNARQGLSKQKETNSGHAIRNADFITRIVFAVIFAGIALFCAIGAFLYLMDEHGVGGVATPITQRIVASLIAGAIGTFSAVMVYLTIRPQKKEPVGFPIEGKEHGDT